LSAKPRNGWRLEINVPRRVSEHIANVPYDLKIIERLGAIDFERPRAPNSGIKVAQSLHWVE
jgi:hypothetical protein